MAKKKKLPFNVNTFLNTVEAVVRTPDGWRMATDIALPI
jgi:hypothetical protein